MHTFIALFAGLITGAIVGTWTVSLFAHAVAARRTDSKALWRCRPQCPTRPRSAPPDRRAVVVTTPATTANPRLPAVAPVTDGDLS